MKLQEIKDAVLAGKTVCWGNDNYEVIVDNIPQFLIWSKFNDHYIGLTHMDNVTMNGKEEQFYIKEGNKYLFIATHSTKEIQKWIEAKDERTAKGLFWDSLTNEEKNATESIEMVDVQKA